MIDLPQQYDLVWGACIYNLVGRHELRQPDVGVLSGSPVGANPRRSGWKRLVLDPGLLHTVLVIGNDIPDRNRLNNIAISHAKLRSVVSHQRREISEFAVPTRNAHVRHAIRRYAPADLIARAAVGGEITSQPQFYLLVWAVLLIDAENSTPRHLVRPHTPVSKAVGSS